MPVRFFWAALKEEGTRAVKVFFEKGDMPEGFNDTTIVLVPKGKKT
jgi:hypothetical protein